MLAELIRSIALDLLAGAVRHPNSDTRDELAEAFWDLQYLYKFGLFGPGPQPWGPIPDPWGPIPDPWRLSPDAWGPFPDPWGPVGRYAGWWQRLTPRPVDRLPSHYDWLVGEMVHDFLDRVAGDPSPQPNLAGVLQNRKARRAALTALAERLESGLKQTREEMERLHEAA